VSAHKAIENVLEVRIRHSFLREAFAVVFFTAGDLSAEHLAVDCHIDPSGYLGVRLEVLWSLVLS
jgi:hypothetical protein